MKKRTLRDVHAEIIVPLTRRTSNLIERGKPEEMALLIRSMDEGVTDAANRYGYKDRTKLPTMIPDFDVDRGVGNEEMKTLIEYAQQHYGLDLKTVKLEDIELSIGIRLTMFLFLSWYLENQKLKPVTLN